MIFPCKILISWRNKCSRQAKSIKCLTIFTQDFYKNHSTQKKSLKILISKSILQMWANRKLFPMNCKYRPSKQLKQVCCFRIFKRNLALCLDFVRTLWRISYKISENWRKQNPASFFPLFFLWITKNWHVTFIFGDFFGEIFLLILKDFFWNLDRIILQPSIFVSPVFLMNYKELRCIVFIGHPTTASSLAYEAAFFELRTTRKLSRILVC